MRSCTLPGGNSALSTQQQAAAQDAWVEHLVALQIVKRGCEELYSSQVAAVHSSPNNRHNKRMMSI